MNLFFRIILRQDASSFGDIAQMEESSRTYLFNTHTEGQTLSETTETTF